MAAVVAFHPGWLEVGVPCDNPFVQGGNQVFPLGCAQVPALSSCTVFDPPRVSMQRPKCFVSSFSLQRLCLHPHPEGVHTVLQLSTSSTARPVDDWDPMTTDPQGDCTEQLLRHQFLRVSLGRCQTKRGQEDEEEQGVSEAPTPWWEEEVPSDKEVPSNSSLMV